ncbi:Rrf2 family transcriptional regulator [Microbacterium sp. M3]|uniref:Rrf2 family transcriptional regulator n=1 Tax=Microbacterium arthrosphaerae TaxID=792652 RepID=A0ABU4GYK5_9MICO|nr:MULTISPECIES: Rrf2 family transcriptional regulator [Microbacterium]MDW4572139.1 Rrf2 family transcriptional regulator [Microbacterium arthrosphaerae]MDW7605994.1 Rrf2 family transcriptional regulator [Microbacterium sp. M3]
MSGGVEWAVHCCVALTEVGRPVPAATLARLHDVSMSYLAKQMQALARAGLVRSVQGKSGGYVLTRAADLISVLDIVIAIEGPEPQFVCTEIRQRGPLAASPEECLRACAIHRTMLAAEQAWRESLRGVTVADLAATVDRESSPEVLPAIRAWLIAPSD